MKFVTTAELFSLRGKTAIVTGAGRGIGQAIAQRLADAGANIVACDLGPDACTETAALIQSAGGQIACVEADVSKASDIARLVKTAVETFGGVDILVNNAALRGWAKWHELTEADWDRFMAVNSKAVFFLSQAVATHMIDRGQGGCIVNIASTAAAHPVRYKVDYNTAKAGVAAMTRSLAVELGPNSIRVNAVGPGGTITPGGTGTAITDELRKMGEDWVARVPLPTKLAQPDDIARVVLFLASPAAGHVTGQVVYADGGYLSG